MCALPAFSAAHIANIPLENPLHTLHSRSGFQARPVSGKRDFRVNVNITKEEKLGIFPASVVLRS
jgi:hypothetical protein